MFCYTYPVSWLFLLFVFTSQLVGSSFYLLHLNSSSNVQSPACLLYRLKLKLALMKKLVT
jgi:hypothetical protein